MAKTDVAAMQDQKTPLACEIREDKIKQIEKLIADLKSRWPAHSVPPAMIQELDDLEDELAELRDN